MVDHLNEWKDWSNICSFFLHCRSFYVGDAAGRKNDHSDADIKFAEVQSYLIDVFIVMKKFYLLYTPVVVYL